MSLNRVFPNPLVKKVAFQLTFPSLFYLEKKIGDFQIKIMKDFPISKLLLQRDFFIVIGGQEELNKLADDKKPPEEGKRVWQFLSEDGVQLDVALDSITLQSNSHKSYNNGEGPRFRETIKKVCDSFIEITQLPIIKRIGLRYIDEGPVPKGSNEEFLSYYNSAFPLTRFPIDNATEMQTRAVVKGEHHSLRYVETLKLEEGKRAAIILDFDAWAENIDPSCYIDVTDALHVATSSEFEKTIKEPIIAYMSTDAGGENE